MPFKRAVWLQRAVLQRVDAPMQVSMPFKRAVWLQHFGIRPSVAADLFQCPLSGQFGCNGGGAKCLYAKGIGGLLREPARLGDLRSSAEGSRGAEVPERQRLPWWREPPSA